MNSGKINRTRLLSAFRELVRIPGPSGRERKIAGAVAARAKALGFRVYEDGAGRRMGTECGNLICT
ncbi:MAG: peptidase M20, partial [Abditibacteriota bacterium]|nr:peptidase M20 [Abditibacteriota bacterium]